MFVFLFIKKSFDTERRNLIIISRPLNHIGSEKVFVFITDGQSLQNFFNAWLLDTDTDSEHLHLILPKDSSSGTCKIFREGVIK